MSDEEILEAISAYPSDMVILTGGEPALWIDEAFIDMLHKAGKYICIETNGTRPLPKRHRLGDFVRPKKEHRSKLTIWMKSRLFIWDKDTVILHQTASQIPLPQPCSCRNTMGDSQLYPSNTRNGNSVYRHIS